MRLPPRHPTSSATARARPGWSSSLPLPLLLTLLLTTWSLPAVRTIGAQGPRAVGAGVMSRPTVVPPAGDRVAWPHREGVTPRAPWYAPVLSAVVPGLGQALLGQQRSVGYAVAEAYLIVQAVESWRDGRRERDAYRAVARDVARARFGGALADGDWDYYERMEAFLESGAYSLGPPGVLIPESDPSTYNGGIWQLARETYWLDPETPPPADSEAWAAAVAFYERRAYRDDRRWSWRDAQLEQDLYRQTIDRSNDAFRRSREFVGLLLANHALSMVDAYVTVRLRLYGATGPAGQRTVGVTGTLPLP